MNATALHANNVGLLRLISPTIGPWGSGGDEPVGAGRLLVSAAMSRAADRDELVEATLLKSPSSRILMSARYTNP